MELTEAKSRIASLYTLIDDLAHSDNVGKGIPSWVLFDGGKIVAAKPQGISFEASPLTAEFIEKHVELWDGLSKMKWTESEARALVDFEQKLWDEHFG